MALKTLNWISLEREVWMQFVMDVFCILWTFTTDTYKVRKKHFKNVETCTAKSSKCNSQTKPGILHMYIVCMYALTFQFGFHTGKLRILLFTDHLRFFLLMKTQQGSLGCLYFPEESQSSVMISNHSPYLYIETSSFTVRDIVHDFSSSQSLSQKLKSILEKTGYNV